MPHRLNDFRAKIQFVCSARMPSLIYKAVIATDNVSNTVYIRNAVCEALSRDLGIPLQELLDEQPEPRGRAAHPFGEDRQPAVRSGPANTVEEVR